MKNKITKLIFVSFLIFLSNNIFAQSKKTVFIKGNISEKTSAVKEASGEEAIWLSNQAILFAIENKELLGTDRDLEGLAVAAIFSISSDNVKARSDEEKQVLINQFIDLFNKFSDSSTVDISIISKVLLLKNDLDISAFISMLNNYIANLTSKSDSSVIKATLNALETVGNSESFVCVYNMWNNPQFAKYNPEIESTLNALVLISMNETLQIIQDKNVTQIIKIFNLVEKNQNISKNSLCEIAENVLNESILLVDNSSNVTAELAKVQLNALKILSSYKWTPASSIALTYFGFAQKEYEQGLLSVEEFTHVISSLLNVAPIYAVTPLSNYLEGLNRQKEQGQEIATEVILSVINTLGAIGDKSAFDSLLAVTYLNYPETVLAAAREALSGLRW